MRVEEAGEHQTERVDGDFSAETECGGDETGVFGCVGGDGVVHLLLADGWGARVDVDGDIEFCDFSPEGGIDGFVEILYSEVVWCANLGVAINRSTFSTKLYDSSFQFLGSSSGVLHRYRGEETKAVRIRFDIGVVHFVVNLCSKLGSVGSVRDALNARSTD